jgi:hypothetical protein
MPTLKEIVIKEALKQPEQVDNLTEESPILSMLDFRKATHTLSNQFEKLYSVTGGSFVDLDAPLGIVKKETKLATTHLIKMGGRIVVGKDKALQYGSALAYFNDQQGPILAKTGMAVEYEILYNNLRQVAIDNDRVIDAGGTGSGLYSIIAVRLKAGENNGLYPADGFPSGYLLKPTVLNGGNLHNVGPNNYPGSEYEDGTMGYAMDLEAYFGWQIANEETVYVIANIKEGKIPSAKDMDTILRKIKRSDNTYLLMHPECRALLQDKYRDYILPAEVSVNNVNRSLKAWDSTPIMESYNFLDGTETAVTVA